MKNDIPVYRLENDAFTKASFEQIDPNNNQIHLCILDFPALAGVSARLGLSDRIVDECLTNRSSKFDSYDGFDFITINRNSSTTNLFIINKHF